MTDKEPITAVEIIARIADEAGALAPQESDGLKFAFRGVNQVVNHLSPFLNKYGLIAKPGRIVDAKVEMHQVGNRYLTDAFVTVEYDFKAPDGSVEVVTTVGYAQDYADRAATQAQSVAWRIALIQTFHLPTDDPEPEVNGELVSGITQAELGRAKSEKVQADEKSVGDLKAEIGKRIAGYTNEATGEVRAPFAGGGEAVNALGDKLHPKDTKRAWSESVKGLTTVLAEMDK